MVLNVISPHFIKTTDGINIINESGSCGDSGDSEM